MTAVLSLAFMSNRFLPVLFAGLLWCHVARAEQDRPPEERFFAGCASSPRLRVHREANLLDLHSVLYTAANLMELEVIRLADWLIDLPLPGAEARPLDRAVKGVRAGYHRLGKRWPFQRFGELIDACQLRELSLGDAAGAYTVATGGTVSPGSGTVVRVNKLLDWTQRLVGDANALGGRLVGRPRGLIWWRLPGRLIDSVQIVVTKTFHVLNVTVARCLDGGVSGVETATEFAVNAARPAAHRDTTVFLRMPTGVYRAHELWVLSHTRRMYVGTAEELARLSHAEVFHLGSLRRSSTRRQGQRRPPRWWDVERFDVEPNTVVLVTDQRTFSSAPQALRAYVVPAAWVLAESAP